MGDCMHFPDTVEEFMEQYKMTDTKQVYSNGIEYVPIFRMEQWFEHEKAQLSQQGTTFDTTSRQAVIDALDCINGTEEVLRSLPPAQSESCEYYALCRHGRDDNKLRVRLGFCEYCNGDVDGFVTPLEKNGHAFVRFGMNGWELSLKANGWHGSAKIRYCPMCGRDLYVK